MSDTLLAMIAVACLLLAVAAIVAMLVSGMIFDEYGWGWIGPGAVSLAMALNAFKLTGADTAVLPRVVHVASIPVGLVGLLVTVVGVLIHLQNRRLRRDELAARAPGR